MFNYPSSNFVKKNKKLLKIIDIGLILQSSEGKYFRYITLSDTNSLKESQYMVFQSNQPYLWKNIEKAEVDNKNIHTLNGRIDSYNGLEIVVFEGEDVKEAFEKQKWKLKDKRKISRNEAEAKISNSQGYLTDKNIGESMNHKLVKLENDVKKIKFRYYHHADLNNINKHSFFEWTEWYEIYD